MTLWTVPGTGYAQQIINAGDGPTMVINRDETIQLYVGNDNSVASKNGTGDIDIVDPLSFIVYDGIDSKFAISSVPNSEIQIQTTKGATNWQSSPAQAAQQIGLLGLATAANQGTQIGAETATANNTGSIATSSGAIETSNAAIQGNTGTIVGNTSSIASSSAQTETNTGSIVTNTQNTINEVVNVNATLGNPAQTVDVVTTLVNNIGGPGGVPVLQGWKPLIASSTAVPANSSMTVNVSPTKPGYYGAIWAFYTGASGGTPFMRVQFRHKDPNTGNFINDVNQWIIGVGATGNFNPAYIRGPHLSSDLDIIFTNLDPAQPMTVFYDIGETSHHIARDDWRGGMLPVGFVPAPSNDMSTLVMFSDPIILSAGQTSPLWVMPLFAGPVSIFADFLPAGGSLSLNINSLPNIGQAPIYQAISAASLVQTPTLISLPRKLCSVQVQNNGTGTAQLSLSIIAQEFVS